MIAEPDSGETPSERIFSAPHVDFAGGVVAILSALATIAAYVYTAVFHPSDASAALIAIGLLSLILCTAIALLAMAYAQKIRKIRRLSRNVERLQNKVDSAHQDHVISAENLNTIFGEFAARLEDGGQTRTPHLGLFVNSVRTIFNRLSSSGKSAVCIKLLKYDHSRSEFHGPYVWTAKRDDTSVLRRGKIDEGPGLKRYEPNDNKAFSDIMSRGTGKDHFLSNDLKNLQGYFNSNPHWHEFYNAAVVVPIKPCRADVLKSTIGFLCVDSLHGTFDEDVSVAVLTLVAEILYRHLRNLSDALSEPPD